MSATPKLTTIRGEGTSDRWIDNEHDVCVCQVFGGNHELAALIVRAVTSHAGLVDALKQIAKGEGAFNRDPLKHAENVINEAIDTARTALAAAEEE